MAVEGIDIKGAIGGAAGLDSSVDGEAGPDPVGLGSAKIDLTLLDGKRPVSTFSLQGTVGTRVLSVGDQATNLYGGLDLTWFPDELLPLSVRTDPLGGGWSAGLALGLLGGFRRGPQAVKNPHFGTNELTLTGADADELDAAASPGHFGIPTGSVTGSGSSAPSTTFHGDIPTFEGWGPDHTVRDLWSGRLAASGVAFLEYQTGWEPLALVASLTGLAGAQVNEYGVPAPLLVAQGNVFLQFDLDGVETAPAPEAAGGSSDWE